MTRCRLLNASLALVSCILLLTAAQAESINAGKRGVSSRRPFDVQTIAQFDTPWAIAFLPDGRMLVTEKAGRIFLATQDGQKHEVATVPAVAASGQNGLLDIAVGPNFAKDSRIYFSYVQSSGGGSRLVLSRARLAITKSGASLSNREIIWRQTPSGGGGQPGGIIAFDPGGTYLFLTVGDRMQPNSAQNPREARGKVLRLSLDGSTPTDNPNAAAGGVEGETWTTGHRNPYGLAFAPDGRLWLHEMGPRGGDEFNLLVPGKNYGWPIVSNGDNYSGTPIPRHATRPEFSAPALYWTPVIAPAGLAFYTGSKFPEWQGSALIGGLRVRSLVRVSFGSNGQPDESDRWDMNSRIRDVAVAPDGTVWLIEDSDTGRLLRLSPKR